MGAVDVQNVIKVYRRDAEEVRVLDGLSLAIPDGEFVALMGPSGSGKTTLLNLIGGVDQPTSGDVNVAGTNIARMGGAALAKWRSSSIGYIFQLYNLIPVLTALENVELPLLLVNMSAASAPRPRSSWWASAIGSSTTRASSRAARSSAWRSRAPSSPIPRCCSPTSPPATSTASPPRRCSR
jgi:putative ABC transport system ATP-binding protein